MEQYFFDRISNYSGFDNSWNGFNRHVFDIVRNIHGTKMIESWDNLPSYLSKDGHKNDDYNSHLSISSKNGRKGSNHDGHSFLLFKDK